jgi:tetratricopeptide (TPR) repeat protein
VLVVAAWAICPTARADELDWMSASERNARAKALYGVAHGHFDLGDFAAATREFKEAYRYKRVPAFLYDAGQAARRAGQPAEALSCFRQYLELDPRAPERVAVRQWIDALEREVAPPSPSPAPREPAAPVVPPPSGASSAPTEAPLEPPPVAGPTGHPATSGASGGVSSGQPGSRTLAGAALVAEPSPPRSRRGLAIGVGVGGGLAVVVGLALAVGLLAAAQPGFPPSTLGPIRSTR